MTAVLDAEHVHEGRKVGGEIARTVAGPGPAGTAVPPQASGRPRGRLAGSRSRRSSKILCESPTACTSSSGTPDGSPCRRYGIRTPLAAQRRRSSRSSCRLRRFAMPTRGLEDSPAITPATRQARPAGAGRPPAQRRIDLDHVVLAAAQAHDDAAREQGELYALGFAGGGLARLPVPHQLHADEQPPAADVAGAPRRRRCPSLPGAARQLVRRPGPCGLSSRSASTSILGRRPSPAYLLAMICARAGGRSPSLGVPCVKPCVTTRHRPTSRMPASCRIFPPGGSPPG